MKIRASFTEFWNYRAPTYLLSVEEVLLYDLLLKERIERMRCGRIEWTWLEIKKVEIRHVIIVI